MDKLLWILLALISGAVLPIQAGLNARMGAAVNSTLYASLISFLVGTAGLIVYILLTRQAPSFAGLRDAPPYLWVGGLLGAVYVTALVVLFPRLGAGLTFGLVVAGQMIVSAILDHYNILVDKPSPISLMKVLGIALIVAGVVIIRKY